MRIPGLEVLRREDPTAAAALQALLERRVVSAETAAWALDEVRGFAEAGEEVGLYMIQKRNRPGEPSTWGCELVSGDDLEHGQAFSLASGTRDDGSGEVGGVYLGAASVTNGVVSW